ITQGEIVSKLDLNAKERRELIDVAAGIKEFDDKKQAALKELEKVEAKINEAHVMLNERIGFLEELRKEKEDAEKYLELSSLLKRANYTILKRKEALLAEEYGRAMKSLAEKSAQLSEIEAKAKSIDLDIEKASSDKQSIINTMNARSSEMSAASKALEEINKSVAVLEAGIKSSESRLTEIASRLGVLNSEKKKISEELESNKLSINAASKELEAKAAVLASLEAAGQGAGGDTARAYGANQKRIYELSAQKESLIIEKARLDSKVREYEGAVESAEEARKKAADEIASLNSELEKVSLEMAETGKSIEAKSINAAMLKSRISSISNGIDELYRQSVDIREKIAVHGGTTSSMLSVLRSEISGFHGYAEELCSYDDKYSTAVRAAGAGRLGYFVVDSIDVANEAIKILKARNIGRATFIPIKEVSVKPEKDSIEGATPILSCIKFDRKYEKVFQYIFSGTYLVSDVESAKKIGIGKCRFVTMEGEVIEPAGIISGGSSRETYAQLNIRLKSLESEKAKKEKELAEANAEYARITKEIASLQVEQMGLDARAKSIKSNMESKSAELRRNEELASASRAQAQEYSKKLEAASSSLSDIESGIGKLKDESESLYGIMTHAQAGAGPAEVSKIKDLRSEVEALRIKAATKAKENEMIEKRLSAIENEILSLGGEGKKLRQENSESAAKLARLRSDAAELQGKIKSHDEKSAGLYKQVTEMDAKIAQMAQLRGKLSSDSEKLRRETFNLESSKAQAETKLGDVKAELLSYSEVQPLDKATEELEKQVILWKADMEKLGAVNMKAPEIYEQKSRDVNEARQKVSTLGSEKDSIIGMMNEIDSKKLSVFSETFEKVNVNFQKLYSYAFPDQAYLELENSKDPFNSGLVIKVKEKSSKEKAQVNPSGGEKSLHLLMLIFAIQMCRPMAFYLFDEIDVSLDKENTTKLSKIIKELSAKSQMIIVSHNDNMIVAADTAIGVAKSNGESKAFGIEVSALKAKEQQPQPSAASA
ncbi:MAG: AAA family ATPase, partial [Candidatus Micrarchaeaceae archaeon]